MKQAEVTKDPWLTACDAHMCPEDVERSLWFQSGQMCMVPPKEASTRRSKGPKKGEWIERTYDKVIGCRSLRRKISQMKVVEDFESKPHNAVSFVVERDRDKEVQEWNEQKMPKALLGYSAGRLTRRNTKARGREDKEEEEDTE